jgi:hypothetical protein
MKERLLITTAIGLMLRRISRSHRVTNQRPSRPPRRKAGLIKIRPRRRSPRRPLLRVRRRQPRTRPRPLPINLRPPRANPRRTQGDISSQAQSNQQQSTNSIATTPSNNAGTTPSQTQSSQRPNASSLRRRPTRRHRQQHHDYPGPGRGALAGVRGDPILPRDDLSGIPEAA